MLFTFIVTITIFAPDYIKHGAQVVITLVVQEKPSRLSKTASILGQRTFYFTVTSLPLKQLDHDPPICQNKLACSTILEDCSSDHLQDDCSLGSWNGWVDVVDNVTGIKSIEVAEEDSDDEEFNSIDNHLVIGSFQEISFPVNGSCCTDRVSLRVTDVAGNTDTCSVSLNSSEGLTTTFGFLGHLFVIFFYMLLL
jgi:hypothetical protein